MTAPDDRTAAKRAAGEAAADRFVADGMRVGLGTGSTAVWAIRRIAERLADGSLRDVLGVPTSAASEAEAVGVGIPLTTLDDHPVLDVTVDGADEVSPRLDLVKGGGGAHLREKIVAQASLRLVVVVDEAKLVPALGTGFADPGRGGADGAAARAGVPRGARRAGHRADGRGRQPFVTDEGNHILDADFGPLAEPAVLLEALHSRAGVVEVGLFLGHGLVRRRRRAPTARSRCWSGSPQSRDVQLPVRVALAQHLLVELAHRRLRHRVDERPALGHLPARHVLGRGTPAARRSRRRTPSRTTTVASGRSPHRSSGTPTTLASTTSGCAISVFSSSTEEIHSPPDLMTSLDRSVSVR